MFLYVTFMMTAPDTQGHTGCTGRLMGGGGNEVVNGRLRSGRGRSAACDGVQRSHVSHVPTERSARTAHTAQTEHRRYSGRAQNSGRQCSGRTQAANSTHRTKEGPRFGTLAGWDLQQEQEKYGWESAHCYPHCRRQEPISECISEGDW